MALFGAIIAVLEGVQHRYQFHTPWFEYRTTSEKLKYEKYLFLALSGPYRNLDKREALLLLSERVEAHISKEHAKGIDTTKQTTQEDKLLTPDLRS